MRKSKFYVFKMYFKRLFLSILLSTVLALEQQDFGDIHADPKSFIDDFKAHHKIDETVGDVKYLKPFC